MYILLLTALFAMELNNLSCSGDIALSSHDKKISDTKTIDVQKHQVITLTANGKSFAKLYPYGGLHWVALNKKIQPLVKTDNRTYISFTHKEKNRSTKSLNCKMDML